MVFQLSFFSRGERIFAKFRVVTTMSKNVHLLEVSFDISILTEQEKIHQIYN